MSILDNLKFLNKPISELAQLPQQTIMQLAQNGQIPMGFVAPILAEKAEKAKAGAQAAAVMQQQELPPSTVLERIITENAVNDTGSEMADTMVEEMPAEIPQQMADAGIGSLPVAEGMMPPAAGFAGGGIVAFDDGGEVKRFQNTGLVDSTDKALLADPTYTEYLKQQALYDKILGQDKATEDLIRYTQAAEKQAAADKDRAFYQRLMQAGLNIMGGTSPYAFENIGKGAAPALEGYMSDMAKQRAAEIERKKTLAELQGKARTQKAEVLGSAQTRIAERDKLRSQERQKELDRANQMAIANLPPDVVRGAQAIRMPGESLGDAVARYNNLTNNKDQYNAAAGLVKSAFDAGSKRFNDSVSAGGAYFGLARAAAGDKSAQREFKVSEEQAKANLEDIRKKFLDEAYEGVGMRPETANQYLRSPAGSMPSPATRQPTRSAAPAQPSAGTGTNNQVNRFPVMAPDGTTYYFPSKEKADEFIRRAQNRNAQGQK